MSGEWFVDGRVCEVVGMACVHAGVHPGEVESWLIRPDEVVLMLRDGRNVEDLMLCVEEFSEVEGRVMDGVFGEDWIVDGFVLDVVSRACEERGIAPGIVRRWTVFPHCVLLMLFDGRVFTFAGE